MDTMNEGVGLLLLSELPPETPRDARANNSCRKCDKNFNVLTRFQQCNHCGYLYCVPCSNHQALMPRGDLASGFDVKCVCFYCVRYLTITAGGKAYLHKLSLAKLKDYMRAYNIEVGLNALEKDDFVNAIISARNPSGCLPEANEKWYRTNGVPIGQNLSSHSRDERRDQSTPSPSGGQNRHSPPPPPPKELPQPRRSAPRNASDTAPQPSSSRSTLQSTTAPSSSHTARPQQQPPSNPSQEQESPRNQNSQPTPDPNLTSPSGSTRVSSPTSPSVTPNMNELLEMPEQSIRFLSVTQLKGILTNNGELLGSVLEKSELVERVIKIQKARRRELSDRIGEAREQERMARAARERVRMEVRERELRERDAMLQEPRAREQEMRDREARQAQERQSREARNRDVGEREREEAREGTEQQRHRYQTTVEDAVESGEGATNVHTPSPVPTPTRSSNGERDEMRDRQYRASPQPPPPPFRSEPPLDIPHCASCDRYFSSEAQLKHHQEEAHSDSSAPRMACPICGNACDVPSHLVQAAQHRRSAALQLRHTASTDIWPRSCFECNAVLENEEATGKHAQLISDHGREVHQSQVENAHDEWQHICWPCDRYFASERELFEHRQNCTSPLSFMTLLEGEILVAIDPMARHGRRAVREEGQSNLPEMEVPPSPVPPPSQRQSEAGATQSGSPEVETEYVVIGAAAEEAPPSPYNNSISDDSFRANPAAGSDAQSAPTGTRTASGNSSSIYECPLCFEEQSELCNVACGHVFCSPCIVQALERESQCPICRMTANVSDIRKVFLS